MLYKAANWHVVSLSSTFRHTVFKISVPESLNKLLAKTKTKKSFRKNMLPQ